jgi:hypothetical protein
VVYNDLPENLYARYLPQMMDNALQVIEKFGKFKTSFNHDKQYTDTLVIRPVVYRFGLSTSDDGCG